MSEENLFKTSNTYKDILEDLKLAFGIFGFIGGLIATIIGGIGLGLAIAMFFIGAVWKFFTANIW